MAEPTSLPADKTFRMAVKLVSTDGHELPFKGFMLVPEDRLVLEKLAMAARDLLARREAAARNVNEVAKVQPALNIIEKTVAELEKVWDFS